MKARTVGSIPFARIILIVILTIMFFSIAVWMVTPAPPVGFYWDDNWYLLMAEWLTPGSEFRGLSLAMMKVTSYPPLFPLVISWSGSGLLEQQNAFVANALFLSTGTGMAMLWFSREHFSVVAMVFAGMLMVFNPITLGYLPILYSEFLFILLSTTALLIACLGKEWKKNSNWLLIGIIVGLAVATRSTGWALVAGFLVHLALGRRLIPALVFSTGLGISLLLIPFLMVGLPTPTINYMNQFVSNMDNLGWTFLVHQLQGLIVGWSMLWGWGVGAWLAAAMVLPGLLFRLKANRVDAWFVVISIGMFLVWPWPGHMGRFLWPLLPCFLICAHSSLRLLQRREHQSIIASVLIGLILATTIPDGIGRSLQRLLDPPDSELFQLSRMHEWTRSGTREEGVTKLRERQQLLKDLKRVGGIVEKNACIYSDMSALVGVQAKRISYPIQWASLTELNMMDVRCKYYYMLPESLPGTSIEELNSFVSKHEELFRSVLPGAQYGEMPLSVFLRFKQSNTR